MRVIYLSLVFLLVILTAGFSQTNGKISGQVSSSDGNPVEFVSILLKGTSKGIITDSKGQFELTGINPGSYVLKASFVGLESQEKKVTVASGQIQTVNFILTESSSHLQEILVSEIRESYTPQNTSPSLRLNEPLIEIPQNIQVVTRDMLNDQQVISMSDGLIRNVSGTIREEHWGDMFTKIISRGSRVQAFRNGFNVVNSFWGPLTEDMSFVDKIEFVKGPAGFMLSNGDPSGLYQVVTKKPTGQTAGEVSFTLGSFDLYRTALDLEGKLSKDGKLLYRLNLAAQNKNSHRPNEYNDRYTIAPVVSYLVRPNTLLTLEYIYQRANMSNVGSYYVFAPDRFAKFPVDFTMLPAGSPGSKMDDHTFMVNLQHDISPNWKLTAQLAKFIYDQEGTSLWVSAVNEDGSVRRYIGIWDAYSDMTMGQVFINGEMKTGAINHRILGGLDVSNKSYLADWGPLHELDSIGAEFDPANPNLGVPVNGYPDFDRETPLAERAQKIGGLIDQRYSSVYFQDELGFIDNKVRITLAARYTDISQSRYGGAPVSAKRVTPRFAISTSINSETSVYGLFDQSFLPQSGRLSSGKDVRPVTGNNFELGIKRSWGGGRWNTTLAAYRIIKENELTADPNSPPNENLSIELGQKRTEGIEFDLSGSPLPGLNMTANYAYTDSRVTEVAEGVTELKVGDIVPGFARHTANAWLSYTLQRGPLAGFGLSSGFTLQEGREINSRNGLDPTQVLPTYFKLDAGISWKKDNIQVGLNVFNLLNEYLYSGAYYSYSKAYYWQTEAPRNARFSVTYKF